MDVDSEVDRLYRTIINDGIEPQGANSRTRLSQITSSGPIAQSDKYGIGILHSIVENPLLFTQGTRKFLSFVMAMALSFLPYLYAFFALMHFGPIHYAWSHRSNVSVFAILYSVFLN